MVFSDDEVENSISTSILVAEYLLPWFALLRKCPLFGYTLRCSERNKRFGYCFVLIILCSKWEKIMVIRTILLWWWLVFDTCSFICQNTSTRRQRSDLFGLRVKLPAVTAN